MKYFIALLCLVIFASCKKDSTDISNEISFLQSKIVFLSKANASALLQSADAYTARFTEFDIKAKTQNVNANSVQQYLTYSGNNTLDWSTDDINALTAIIKSAESKIKQMGLNLNLPSQIKIIKSSALEEAGNPYTRLDEIVFSDLPDEALFLHELFHIFSRNNPSKRDQIYAVFGFNKINAVQIPLPYDNFRITNPDAPFLEHSINVTIQGQPAEVVFVTLSDRNYTGGSFFDYLSLKLMPVAGTPKAPIMQNGEPLLFVVDDADNLVDQIGNNTNYILHPEEICADNFKLMVLGSTVPKPALINSMKALLK